MTINLRGFTSFAGCIGKSHNFDRCGFETLEKINLIKAESRFSSFICFHRNAVASSCVFLETTILIIWKLFSLTGLVLRFELWEFLESKLCFDPAENRGGSETFWGMEFYNNSAMYKRKEMISWVSRERNDYESKVCRNIWAKLARLNNLAATQRIYSNFAVKNWRHHRCELHESRMM